MVVFSFDLRSAQEDVPQHDGVGVSLVLRRIEKGDQSLPRLVSQFAESIGMPRELGPIAAAKFCPTFRVVTEPRPERAAWRDLAIPYVNFCLSLRDPAWPEPIDKDSGPVIPGGGLIDPLDSNVLG